MSFSWPAMLLFLLLVPLAALFYARLQARRLKIVERFGSLGFSPGGAARDPGRAGHVPPAVFLTGFAILVFSLARPQMSISIPKVEGTIMLVFDVSGSMAADDIQPTRMEAAKAAAREFVQHQPASIQMGVVAFSDGGLAVQAPTNNRDEILESIDQLSPQRGTSLGHGMTTGLHAIATSLGHDLRTQELLPGADLAQPAYPAPDILPGTFDSTAILLLSDGENNTSPDPLEVAQAAGELGIRIHTIGVGSSAGTTLQVDGFSVHTQLNEEMLQQIARISGGTYYNPGPEQKMQEIYENLNLQLVVKPEEMEVTSLFAGASILIMLAGGLFSLLWFGRLP